MQYHDAAGLFCSKGAEGTDISAFRVVDGCKEWRANGKLHRERRVDNYEDGFNRAILLREGNGS